MVFSSDWSFNLAVFFHSYRAPVNGQFSPPLMCSSTVLKSDSPYLCNKHAEDTRKHISASLKKSGAPATISARLASKFQFHLVIKEYVNHIQSKRRANANGNDRVWIPLHFILIDVYISNRARLTSWSSKYEAFHSTRKKLCWLFVNLPCWSNVYDSFPPSFLSSVFRCGKMTYWPVTEPDNSRSTD